MERFGSATLVHRVRRSILVHTRTYPELSTRYRESVCTGGVFTDDGAWCRIYPFPARYLEEAVKRWDIISAEVWQDPSHDPRPESWKINPQSIHKIGHLETGRGSPPNWDARREQLFSASRVFSSVEEIEKAQRRDGTSLGLVQPRRRASVRAESRPPEDRDAWDKKLGDLLDQGDLLERPKALDYLDKRIKVRFRCEGADCEREHDCSVLDWEICQLARRDGWEAAIDKLDALLDRDAYDTWFIMGNFRQHPQSFGIVGIWYPRATAQLRLL